MHVIAVCISACFAAFIHSFRVMFVDRTISNLRHFRFDVESSETGRRAAPEGGAAQEGRA